MAIDKRRTAPWLKVTIVVVALLMVVSMLMAPFVDVIANSASQPRTGTGVAAESAETIAARYQPQTAAFEEQLQKEPKNYDLLVNQANAYFDWASELQKLNTGQQQSRQDAPTWLSATTYYGRALKVKPGDPNVMTDYSVALFYSGQIDAAIKQVETVMAKDPEFKQALFNAALYYQAAGRHNEAVAVAQRYLKADPNGQFAQTAQAIVAQSSAAAKVTTSSVGATSAK